MCINSTSGYKFNTNNEFSEPNSLQNENISQAQT